MSYGSKNVPFSELIGKTLTAINVGDEEINFVCDNGSIYRQVHYSDCCEVVTVEDVVGDTEDLLNTPILSAEEETNSSSGPKEDGEESYTWTFYKLATIKGSVTIRWYGTSNGYYSEHVDFEKVK